MYSMMLTMALAAPLPDDRVQPQPPDRWIVESEGPFAYNNGDMFYLHYVRHARAESNLCYGMTQDYTYAFLLASTLNRRKIKVTNMGLYIGGRLRRSIEMEVGRLYPLPP